MRKIDIGDAAVKAVPDPIWVITSNQGTPKEATIQEIYAPMSAAQMSAIGANSVVGSTTHDSTSGALFIHDGTAFVAG